MKSQSGPQKDGRRLRSLKIVLSKPHIPDEEKERILTLTLNKAATTFRKNNPNLSAEQAFEKAMSWLKGKLR